ncbi:rhodanese-like domain-containing protein [Aquimarina sp. RZ0]|uniref:rhodanese-like domain-containing protein n=1 Tax=Aquimarina sp. RZ0 TaxID=2607730 RepID=UPI0011F15830|nr:rhodanese-like domain-containing protein [Aquimarina sp. RZ0]KAA1245822.1 rhodanese-like domain-containing protein [Aquimarina sp. RZ0]
MRIKTILITAFFSLLICSCKDSKNTNIASVQLITVEEMDKLLELEKVQLVDVRTPKEFANGHIDGAININFYDENFETLISTIDKSKPIAVYCGRGGRSAKCSAYMEKAGFTKIYDLDGGLTEWKYKGKEVVK